MKFLIFFALALAATSAFDLRSSKIEPRDIVKTAIKHEGRITHGNTAFVGQFKYQVGLILWNKDFSSTWCGGSLIDANWVLTAAHCTEGAVYATVLLGATVRTSPEITLSVSSENIIIHDEFNRTNLNNDISLIKIPAVTYSEKIEPIKLPAIGNSYSTYAGDSVIISGWGRNSDSDSSITNNLQFAEFQVISNSKCEASYVTSWILPSTICVNTINRVSTCSGDSGSPMVLKSTNVQIGITSFVAKDGCEKGIPAAFVRITSYLDWIKSNTGISY